MVIFNALVALSPPQSLSASFAVEVVVGFAPNTFNEKKNLFAVARERKFTSTYNMIMQMALGNLIIIHFDSTIQHQKVHGEKT